MSVRLEVCHRPWPLLHRLVSSHLSELVEAAENAGKWFPSYVRREFESYLRCGDPTEGFAWLRCGDCDHNRIVPFSCKGRGFCPSCGGRRMAERAARWTEELFPEVAVRQYVLTLPWRVRWLVARRPVLARGILHLALREVFGWYKRKARLMGLMESRCGSVTVVQRFGSALNLNVHFHVLAMDGCYARDPKTGKLRFYRVGKPTTKDIEGLVSRIAVRSERWLEKMGFGFGSEDALDEDPEDALPLLQAASVTGKAAL